MEDQRKGLHVQEIVIIKGFIFYLFLKEGRVEILCESHLWLLAQSYFSQRTELYAPGEGSHTLDVEKGDSGCSPGCWEEMN